MSADFKPSDVVMWRAVMPLIDTFGRAEMEAAAALIVLVCQRRGDVWAPVSAKSVGGELRSVIADGVEPWASVNRNPFFRPDIRALISKGFAQWVGGDESQVVEFTAAGFDRVRPGTCATCRRWPGAAVHQVAADRPLNSDQHKFTATPTPAGKETP